jgi:hypothetical protein
MQLIRQAGRVREWWMAQPLLLALWLRQQRKLRVRPRMLLLASCTALSMLQARWHTLQSLSLAMLLTQSVMSAMQQLTGPGQQLRVWLMGLLMGQALWQKLARRQDMQPSTLLSTLQAVCHTQPTLSAPMLQTGSAVLHTQQGAQLMRLSTAQLTGQGLQRSLAKRRFMAQGRSCRRVSTQHSTQQARWRTRPGLLLPALLAACRMHHMRQQAQCMEPQTQLLTLLPTQQGLQQSLAGRRCMAQGMLPTRLVTQPGVRLMMHRQLLTTAVASSHTA